jgi:hypothetical protein
MPISRSIRRGDHPRRPKAMTYCFFSSFKTLLTRTEDTLLSSESTSWMVVYNWPVLGDPRGWVMSVFPSTPGVELPEIACNLPTPVRDEVLASFPEITEWVMIRVNGIELSLQ